MTRKTKVAVVFDLDETIGHFWQLGKLWEGLRVFKDKKFNEKDFHKILDSFPHIFRPGIFNVFNYLKDQKRNDRGIKVIIYSNNMGTPKWANMIKKYIEKKIDYKLFDKVITAWKVNGTIYEKCRRTNEKTYSEIVRCGKLNKKTQIFFVDDAYHPRMYNKMTEYMHIKQWKFEYNIKSMVEKVLKSCTKLTDKDKEELQQKLPQYIERQDWGNIRYSNGKSPSNEEKKLGKELLVNIKTFLKEKNKNTLNNKRKNKRKNKRWTRKKN